MGEKAANVVFCVKTIKNDVKSRNFFDFFEIWFLYYELYPSFVFAWWEIRFRAPQKWHNLPKPVFESKQCVKKHEFWTSQEKMIREVLDRNLAPNSIVLAF